MRILGLHHAPGALGGQQGAVEVDCKHTPPGLEWKLQQRRDVKDASVVDQDIQAPERFDGGVDGAADGGCVGAVSVDRQGFAAFADHAVLQCFGLGGRADIGERDGCALGGQALDDGGADTARTALDQGDFAAEVLCGHVDLQKVC